MAVYRREMYSWGYETRIPVTEKDAEKIENKQESGDNKTNSAYGCNLLNRTGECALKQMITKNQEGGDILIVSCKTDMMTPSRAEAHKNEGDCRKIHDMIRKSYKD